MSRSQYSYISDNNQNTPFVHTPKESRQIKNIAEQIYNVYIIIIILILIYK